MPAHYKEKIIEITEVLGRNPVPSELYDIPKLSGKYDSYRIRIGNIRMS
jgi:mRNA-degrading endonuclease RelE of RelBE toxin-antitoxin system